MSKSHHVPVSHDIEGTSQHQDVTYHRFQSCNILHKLDHEICSECEKGIVAEEKKLSRKARNSATPAKKFAPTSKTDPKRVILALEQKCDMLQSDIDRLKQEINDKGVTVDRDTCLQIWTK